MRGYVELIDFMRELGDGIQDHLPEDQRNSKKPLEVIVSDWVDGKSFLEIRSLRGDILTYIKKYNAGDHSVDQILSDFDLVFIPERFGCEESILLAKVVLMIDGRVVEKRRSVLNDLCSWLAVKLNQLFACK